MRTLIRESALFRLCLFLCRPWLVLAQAYGKSRLCAGLNRCADWLEEQLASSRILHWLEHGRSAADVWKNSRTCRILQVLANLPAAVLHGLYDRTGALLAESWFANGLFAFCRESAVLQAWIIMLLWSLPFKYWNNAYHLAAFALLLVLFWLRGMKYPQDRIQVSRMGVYYPLYLSAVLLAFLVSTSMASSMRFLLFHLSAALCVTLTANAVRREEDLKRLAAGGGFAASVAGVYGIVQRLQGFEVNLTYVDLSTNPDMPGRVESLFDNPNTFAEALLLLLPLLAALALTSKHRISRLAAAAGFAAGVTALGMTYSRSSWIGLAVAAAVFVFLLRPRLIPLFALACLACVPLLPRTVLTRIVSIVNSADTGAMTRVPMHQAAIRTIRDHPLIGAGLGMNAVQEYVKAHEYYLQPTPFVHSHNLYLQIWAEGGILMLLGFLSSMAWNIRQTLAAVRRTAATAAGAITAACCASMCGILVTGMADNPWNYPRVLVMFWFVFGLGIAGVRICEEQEKA